jgi:RimJ/RimL family protein N-acetyltransferase
MRPLVSGAIVRSDPAGKVGRVELSSPRLRLRLLGRTEVRALLDGRTPGGLAWADGYPLDGGLVTAAMQHQLHAEDITTGPFGLFQIVRREDSLVVGDIGFHSPPCELGEVSVGFGIVPAHRRRGYATEALRTLLAWTLEQPEVRAVHADTDLVHLASQRVLAHAGMVVVADEGDRKLFEIIAPVHAA